MKRLLSGTIILLISVIIGIYLFIPSTITISLTAEVAQSTETTFRLLSNQSNWHYPADTNIAKPITDEVRNNRFQVKDVSVSIDGIQYNAYKTTLSKGQLTATGLLNILPRSIDSSFLHWQVTAPAGNDPFTRIKHYVDAAGLKASMVHQINHMAAFLNNTELVYGYPFKVTSTKDTTLIATKTKLTTPPGTSDIYALVNTLKRYAEQNGMKQTGDPMVNITTGANNNVDVMVALPVDKVLADNNKIFYRKMIPGNFLVTDVKGGPGTIRHAYSMMQQYIADKQKTVMAIPFEVLISDRSKETDTTKWITRIYYPILR